MKKVSLSNCEHGDVLAKPIVSNSGVILAGEGTKLTSRLISRFSEGNIETLWIEGDDSLNQEDFEKQMKQIQNRFSSSQDDSLLMGIKKILTDGLKKRAGQIDAAN